MTTWLRWHAAELAAVLLPATAAVTVSPWWAVLAGAVGARWVWLEVRVHRAVSGRPPPGERHPMPDDEECDDEERGTA